MNNTGNEIEGAMEVSRRPNATKCHQFIIMFSIFFSLLQFSVVSKKHCQLCWLSSLALDSASLNLVSVLRYIKLSGSDSFIFCYVPSKESFACLK